MPDNSVGADDSVSNADADYNCAYHEHANGGGAGL